MKAYYIGLDIHKKTISYCVKIQDGKIDDAAKSPYTALHSLFGCLKYKSVRLHIQKARAPCL